MRGVVVCNELQAATGMGAGMGAMRVQLMPSGLQRTHTGMRQLGPPRHPTPGIGAALRPPDWLSSSHLKLYRAGRILSRQALRHMRGLPPGGVGGGAGVVHQDL